jgi:hypothetical protein
MWQTGQGRTAMLNVPDEVRHAIGQANASLIGIPHEMAFTTAVDIIKGWADDISDSWTNDETGEETESWTCAEEWLEDGDRVHEKSRKERLKEVVGRELVPYL